MARIEDLYLLESPAGFIPILCQAGPAEPSRLIRWGQPGGPPYSFSGRGLIACSGQGDSFLKQGVNYISWTIHRQAS
jgi:hypothetical protein